MAIVVYQILPDLLKIIYRRSLTKAYFNGFQYYLYQYTDRKGEIVRTN